MERPLALVVDKDPAARAVIRAVFEEHDIAAIGAASGTEVTEALRTQPIRFIVIDCDTPGVDALAIIRHGTSLTPEPIVIGMAPAADTARALEMATTGALDVLSKPFEEVQLQQVVRRVLRHHSLAEEVRRLREDLQGREGYQGLVGKSPPMERLRERIRRLAVTHGPVWFTGERGTGKELAARTLHGFAGGDEASFHVVDCASMTRQSWDALLAATDGDTKQSVYLDDLPAMAPDLQARVISLLGSGSRRVFSSSTRPPAVEMEGGRLDQDLCRALAPETVEIPALRERIEDIALLSRHFIETICTINHLPPIRLTSETISLLENHGWTENVEGLRSAMEHAVILAEDGKIVPGNLPDRIVRNAGGGGIPASTSNPSLRRFRDAKREVVESFERSYLCDLMKRFDGNVTAASQRAGMLRSALQRLLRKYGLRSAEFRKQRRPVGAIRASRSRD